MVKFKCIVSGNFVSFEQEVDIVTTRANPAYEEVKEEVKPVTEAKEKKTATKTKEV